MLTTLDSELYGTDCRGGNIAVAQENLSNKTEETVAQNTLSQDDPFPLDTLMLPALSPQPQKAPKRGCFSR